VTIAALAGRRAFARRYRRIARERGAGARVVFAAHRSEDHRPRGLLTLASGPQYVPEV
jgi:hypothetical protein